MHSNTVIWRKEIHLLSVFVCVCVVVLLLHSFLPLGHHVNSNNLILKDSSIRSIWT